MASPFVHWNRASKVIMRNNAAQALRAELAAIGVCRPVLLSGETTGRSKLYAGVRSAVDGSAVAEFNSIPRHSSISVVESIVALARDHQADALIAVGGGSTSDTAKATALLLGEGGRLEDHASRFTPPDGIFIPELKKPKIPIISFPCTASGAEVTPSLGIKSDDGKKLLFWDVQLASHLIAIDPLANLDVPVSVMLATGVNGLAHCVEGLYSKTRTPITDALSLHAISLFASALPRVAQAPDSVECRADLLIAGHLSGLVLMNARTCIHHAICHAIGAALGVAHGDVNAVILPHAMRFNAPETQAAMASFARAWNGKPSDAIDCVKDLQQQIGVPTRLRDIGVPRDALSAIAEKVMGERGVYFNPRIVKGAYEIKMLLEEAF